MDGLSMNGEQNPKHFNHRMYANLLEQWNKVDAEKYINSFNVSKPQVQPIQEVAKEVAKDPELIKEPEVVIIPDKLPKEEMTILRSEYEKKFGTRPFPGWNAKQLVEKINKV